MGSDINKDPDLLGCTGLDAQINNVFTDGKHKGIFYPNGMTGKLTGAPGSTPSTYTPYPVQVPCLRPSRPPHHGFGTFATRVVLPDELFGR